MHGVRRLAAVALLVAVAEACGAPPAGGARPEPAPAPAATPLARAQAAYRAVLADSSRRRLEAALAAIQAADSALWAEAASQQRQPGGEAGAIRHLLFFTASRLAEAAGRDAERTRDCEAARRAQAVAQLALVAFNCDLDCTAEHAARLEAAERVSARAPGQVRALCGAG